MTTSQGAGNMEMEGGLVLTARETRALHSMMESYERALSRRLAALGFRPRLIEVEICRATAGRDV